MLSPRSIEVWLGNPMPALEFIEVGSLATKYEHGTRILSLTLVDLSMGARDSISSPSIEVLAWASMDLSAGDKDLDPTSMNPSGKERIGRCGSRPGLDGHGVHVLRTQAQALRSRA